MSPPGLYGCARIARAAMLLCMRHPGNRWSESGVIDGLVRGAGSLRAVRAARGWADSAGRSALQDRGDRCITVLCQFFRPSGQSRLDAIRYRTQAIIDGTRCLFLKRKLASVELTTNSPSIGVRWVRQKGANREGLPNVAYSLIRR